MEDEGDISHGVTQGVAGEATSARAPLFHAAVGLHETRGFDWFDYFLFCAMLAVSAVIGVYFAFFAKQKQNTTSEYLMGGKRMPLFPVTMSLIASWVSGITLLGMPAEMYTFGTQFWIGIIGLGITCLITGVFYLPVIHKLQITTSYEYLALRFSQKVRVLGSLLFIINHLLYIPIVIYLPALAFSQVTGVSLHLITPIVCLVCIFYTSLGGMKAVVWTDALQMVMMFGSMAVVVFVGTVSLGGPQVVWERNRNSTRIEFFNMDIDPTVRHTFWNVIIGFIFMWVTSLAANQGMIQRFLAMRKIEQCYKMLFLYWIGVGIIASLSCYSGLLVYATYHECDLISSRKVNAPDQILPYYVMDVTGFIYGLPGLFMAGVSSAALSTMSTGLNAMSGVIFEDFIYPFLEIKPSEEKASFYMKIICVILGIISVGMVFVVENLGAVLQVSASFSGITSGPLLALFTLGMFFPWTNTKGTMTGGVFGLVAMGWIVLSSQYAISSGRIKLPVKPMTIEGCGSAIAGNVTSTLTAENDFPKFTSSATTLDQEWDEPWVIFRISYTLYSMIGFFLTVSVGLLVSWLTKGKNPPAIHPDLLTPLVQKYYRLNRPAETTKSCPESIPLNQEVDTTHKKEDLDGHDIAKNGQFILSTMVKKMTKGEEER